MYSICFIHLSCQYSHLQSFKAKRTGRSPWPCSGVIFLAMPKNAEVVSSQFCSKKTGCLKERVRSETTRKNRFNLDAFVDCNTVTLNGLLSACSSQQAWRAACVEQNQYHSTKRFFYGRRRSCLVISGNCISVQDGPSPLCSFQHIPIVTCFLGQSR